MFAGIIQAVGTIDRLTWESDSSLRLSIATPHAAAWAKLGASIACNGICLTVVAGDAGHFEVQLSPETLACTTAASWQVGSRLNLEPSLKLGDTIDGHFVFGHVDGLATITEIVAQADYWQVALRVPPDLLPFFAAKGSVALNGTSLTINSLLADGFQIMLIPHSWHHTTFSDLRAGDQVNCEVDMLARYVARQLAFAESNTP
jgi:riboflavin synthase